MNKNIIDVELITEEEKQLLVFNFDEKIFLDLASDNAEELKDFFQQLLIKILEKNIELNFVEKDRNDLFYDVAKKYVDHLKVEIASIVNQQLNKIDD
mgnify:CR=1 FL=1